MNKNQHWLIAALSCLCFALMLGHLQLTTPAQAAQIATGKDFQMITAQIVGGAGDGVYVIDNRSGVIALFYWNASTKRIEPKNVRFLSDLMADDPIGNPR